MSLSKVVGIDKPLLSIASHMHSVPENSESSVIDKAFPLFMNNLPGLTWIVDKKGFFQYMNPAYLKMFQLTQQDIGKNVSDLFPVEIAKEYVKNNQKVLRSKTTIYTNESGILPDGRKRTFKVVKFLIPYENTHFIGGIAIDISDDIEQQQQYFRDLERFELINQATSEITWDIDLLSGKRTRGGSIEKVFGYQPGDDEESKDFAHVHPEDRNRVKRSFNRLLKSKQTIWEDIYRVQSKNGDYHTIINKALVVRNEKGKAVRVVGAARSIAKEMMLKEALIAKEHELRLEMGNSLISLQERERKEMAYELHENLAQLLTTTGLLMDSAYEKCDKDLMIESKKVLHTAINELRRLQQQLNPDNIDMVGLYPALHEQIHRVNEKGSTRIQLLFDVNEEWITKHQKLCVLRIVQEQLRNIIRHSNAKKAKIVLRIDKNKLKLKIVDDGTGFEKESVDFGVGLKSIQSRVETLGGVLFLITAPGKGCVLEVEFNISK